MMCYSFKTLGDNSLVDLPFEFIYGQHKFRFVFHALWGKQNIHNSPAVSPTGPAQGALKILLIYIALLVHETLQLPLMFLNKIWIRISWSWNIQTLIKRRLPNLVARSLSAEISENVHPPRNMISLHFDPGDSLVLESKENESKF